MTIEISNFSLDVFIGILDFEHLEKQKLDIELFITYNYENSNFIDYAQIIELIKIFFNSKKFGLLENAAVDCVEHLKQLFPNIESISIKLFKPEILNPIKVGINYKKNFD